MRRVALLVVGILVLAGCGPADSASPEGSATASGSAAATGGLSPAPDGPIIELGEGPVLDTTWRYALYPSGTERCTLLEVAGTVATRCGELLPAEGDAFGAVGWASPELTRFQALEGFVTTEVATVWLLGEGQYRIPAILVSLDPAEIDALGFVAFGEAGVALTHLQAVARSGEILQTLELDPP